ncbi:MAG: YqaE/Pmp3 family membrane protein [Bacteroidetes bacterium]|nr:MAG: YqaE/Pmp3 family membrane protein [Bacteroidota bacterium]
MSTAQKAGVGLYILAFFIPFLAVGIHTGWKKPTLYCFLWSLLGWVPGIIHAFIQLGK